LHGGGDIGTHINMPEHELQQQKFGLPTEDAIMFVECGCLFISFHY